MNKALNGSMHRTSRGGSHPPLAQTSPLPLPQTPPPSSSTGGSKGGSAPLVEFEKALDASETLAAASKQLYKERLRSIASATGHVADFDWNISHPDDTWEALHAVRKPSRTPGSKEPPKPLSDQTLRASAAAMVTLFKHASRLTSKIKGHAAALEGWQELLKESTEIAQVKYDDIQPSERQKEAHIEWSDLIAVRDRLIKAFREGKKDPAGAPDDAYLVLSLLTFIPPSRADWGAVRVFRSGKEPRVVGSAEEKGMNYVVLEPFQEPFLRGPNGPRQKLHQNANRTLGTGQLHQNANRTLGTGQLHQNTHRTLGAGQLHQNTLISQQQQQQQQIGSSSQSKTVEPPFVCWNRYKTAKSYGRQVRSLPVELAKIIEETLKARTSLSKSDEEWLVRKKNGEPHNNHGFAVHVSYTLQKLFDRPATLDTLRHSFVNHSKIWELTPKQMDALALDLRHSVAMMSRYRLKFEDPIQGSCDITCANKRI